MRSPQEILSIVRIRDKSNIYENVKQGFNLIGNPKFRSSDLVAIKPN